MNTTSPHLTLFSMFVLYIKQCLLFKSNNRVHITMGIFGWLSVITFTYAMIQLYLITQLLMQHRAMG